MHIHVYIITLAEDVEDAKSNVSSWIDEYADREFFDWGGLEEPDDVVLLSEIIGELEKEKEEADKRIPYYEEKIAVSKAQKSRSMTGFYYKQLGMILCENPTDDMPFFNIEQWDWSLPTEVPKKAAGMNWYAVKADLHY